MNVKRILGYMLPLIIVMGCAEELIPENSFGEQDLMIPLNINGSINQIPTKANASGFVENDAIGLFAVNYLERNTVPGTLLVAGNQADNAQYVLKEGSGKWEASRKVYYKDVNTNVDLYVYYPYQQRIEDVSAFGFEVQKDQSSAAAGEMGGYEASDFLWGKAENITPVESAVRVLLSHRLAAVKVILSEKDGFGEGEFESLEKSVILTNTTRKATIDFSTGTATPVGEPQLDGIIMAPQTDQSFRAVVIPQSVVSGTRLFSITIDGVSYGFKLNSDVDYVSGKQLEVNISISKKAPAGEYTMELGSMEICDWTEDNGTHGGEARQYYVVNMETAGTLGQVITGAGKNPAKIKNLKITGTMNASDFSFIRSNMTILQALNIKEVSVVGSEIPSSALNGKSSLYYCTLPDAVVKIGDNAFSGTKLTGSLIIPDKVEYIGKNAFQNCLITSLSLSPVLKTIGSSAFNGCKFLTGPLTLPNGIEYIGTSAFEGCQGFSGRLVLPNSLTYIGPGAFCNAGTFVGGLRVPDKITRLDDVPAYGTFTRISGPLDLNNLQYAGRFAFGGWATTSSFTGELVLPEGIQLGQRAFSDMPISSVVFASTLTEIANESFIGCWRLVQDLDFPEGLIYINDSAFSGCRGITGIHLHKNVSVIGSDAFNGCSGIGKIICDAPNPPTLGSNAFSGVPKNNFTVEVPEGSVTKYRSAPGWRDFVRIEAHQDFSVSKSYYKTLNAAASKEFVLRCPANKTWSIESKPDWVTVTPSSGTGKTDIVVSVNELQSGSKNRSESIVFVLDEKGYTCNMQVSQYDYAYSDGDVITLQNATIGDGVDIVLLGDCYDAEDIAKGTYLKNLRDAYEWFFKVEPYTTYKDYFNVYAVVGESEDSGMGTVNTVKESRFGSQYTINAGVAPNQATCFQYACKAPIDGNVSQTLIILVENSNQYGGVTYMYGDGSAIAVCPVSSDAYPFDFRGIVQHEAAGHGFGKLGDEYIYVNAFISNCKDQTHEHLGKFNAMKARGWYRNLELTGDMHNVGWSHLLYNPAYSDYVDVFEGGFFHTRGVFRSETTSCMNNNIPYFSAISRQAIVERIMEYAGEEFSIEHFFQNDVSGFGPSTKAGAIPYDWGVRIDFTDGKQMMPVYMGEHPEF